MDLNVPIDENDLLYLNKSVLTRQAKFPSPSHMPLDYLPEEKPTAEEIEAIKRNIQRAGWDFIPSDDAPLLRLMLDEYLVNSGHEEWLDRNEWKVSNINKKVHVKKTLQ